MSLRFTYPAAAKETADASNRALDADAHRPRNIDYWFCGNPAFSPSPPPMTACTRD